MEKKLATIKNDLLLVILLLVAGFKYTYGLESVLDVYLYDESNYLNSGVMLLRDGLPNPQLDVLFAPLYSLWYFFLSLLQPDRIELYYLNYKVITILLPVLLYCVMRRYNVKIIPSATISFLFLISRANLMVWPKVSHFTLLVILTTLLLTTYTKKSSTISLAIVCVGTLLGAYARPELFIAFLFLLFALFGFTICRRSYQQTGRIALFLGILLISGLLVKWVGVPIAGGRSLVAFGQHFSHNWVEWTGEEDLNPWTNWEEITYQNFGNIQNIKDALLNNPILLLKHISTNITNTPGAISILLFDHANIIIPDRHKNYLESYMILGLFAIYLIVTIKRWLPQLHERIIENHILFVALACYAAITLISIAIIFPREHYLILPIILLVICTAILCLGQNNEKEDNLGWPTLIFGLLFVFLTPHFSFYLGTATHTPNVETIHFIEELKIEEDVKMLEAEGGFDIYLPDNYQRIAEYTKKTDYHTFQCQNNINMVVLTKRLENYARLKDDEEWKYFLLNYLKEGYTKLEIPKTDRQLIVDKKLLYPQL